MDNLSACKDGTVNFNSMITLSVGRYLISALRAFTSPARPRSSYEYTSAGRRVVVSGLVPHVSESHISFLPTVSRQAEAYYSKFLLKKDGTVITTVKFLSFNSC